MQELLAFEDPWQVLELLGIIVVLRVGVPHVPFLRNGRRGIMEFIDSGLVAVLLVFFVLRPFVIQAFFIPSGSMEPTLLISDRLLVNKSIYYFRDPQAGDIVVFRAPPQASQVRKDFIKRVVGTPGDVLELRDGKLYCNGALRDEPYIQGPMPRRWRALPQPYTVPEGYVVVFGDNRSNSNDSHSWGPLPRANILGKALVTFWPPHRIGLVR